MITIWAFVLFPWWARSVVPHMRIDPLIATGWTGMLVLSVATLLLTAVIVGGSGNKTRGGGLKPF